MGKDIPFRVLEINKNRGNSDDLAFSESDNKVVVTITREMPTPGYSLDVQRIVKEGDSYQIYFNIKPLEADIVNLQVLTYKTIDLEIDREDIGDSPYKFILNENIIC